MTSLTEDRPIIVSAVEHARLQFRAKIWWSGWAAAILLVGAVGYMVGRVSMALEARDELERLLDDVAKVQAEQRIINGSFIKAWENQRETARLVISWADYIKQRDEIILENNSGAKMATKK